MDGTTLEDEDYTFLAKLGNARNLSHILKAIHFKDVATVFVTENGLKVTVEDAKCLQANAFIQATVFDEYDVHEEVNFCINLNVLQECLTIFGSSSIMTTSLKMVYGGYGSPLTLTLEEENITTDCSIKTQESEETLDFEFCAANVVNKIIMKADCLRDAFNELDHTSDVVEITMSPQKPYFRLSSSGYCGRTDNDIHKDSDMVEIFQCSEPQSNQYRLSLLKPSVKAVNLASKVCIRMDHRGFLSFQYMIKNESGQICFVEYYCCPDEKFDEEDV
ncbi:cell cycle checkpoint protein RAD1-like [Styela clava]